MTSPSLFQKTFKFGAIVVLCNLRTTCEILEHTIYVKKTTYIIVSLECISDHEVNLVIETMNKRYFLIDGILQQFLDSISFPRYHACTVITLAYKWCRIKSLLYTYLNYLATRWLSIEFVMFQLCDVELMFSIQLKSSQHYFCHEFHHTSTWTCCSQCSFSSKQYFLLRWLPYLP